MNKGFYRFGAVLAGVLLVLGANGGMQVNATEMTEEVIVSAEEPQVGETAEEQAEPQDEESVEPQTELPVRGAVVWPVEDTSLFDNRGNIVLEVKAGTPMKVLFYADGYFKVFCQKKVGLVDCNICMINLPDVMQKEMQYDITNSYSSIYKIHGYDIKDVTGEVLYPYAKVGAKRYLVPLLYPVALKLYEAEEDAIERGYTIKVYDAYRPYTVTKDIYAKTSDFVAANPVYGEYMTAPVNGVKYAQNNFLAKSVSNHNYGVAVDITLVDLATGKELQMQAPMHELSTRSVLSLNNENADLLSDIMLSNGFNGLASEWWHFDIREYRRSYAAFQVKPFARFT